MSEREWTQCGCVDRLVVCGAAHWTSNGPREVESEIALTRPHDAGKGPFGEDLQRYWDRRYEIFEKFDDGICTDREGLYSATPEDLALEQAERLSGETVVDAFAGVGGSAIGFASAGKRVVAIDTDECRLRLARHNAAIYGVADAMDFVVGDAMQLMGTIRGEAIHLDPPWGGPRYRRSSKFALADFDPDGAALLSEALLHFPEVSFRLPLNFDLAELYQFGRTFVRYSDYSHGRIVSRSVVFGGRTL